MNLIIFGATGIVGKELVKQALHKGHHERHMEENVFTEDMPKMTTLNWFRVLCLMQAWPTSDKGL
jgi:putative NADH-flavin reductase